ncbi:MAG: Uma2 family endonuclease [Deltaproteobacteria bacterium]|nr:Uma2 family endonuclease [Nannocystaceae bacterium]
MRVVSSSSKQRDVGEVRQCREPAGFVRQGAALVDWSRWFVTDEDDVGESFEHGEMIRLLLSSLDVLGRERAWHDRLWASDQFFAWRPEHPLVRVSPDVYVLDDPPPPPRPASWQTWLPGHRPPTLAIEIVSDDWTKDYREAPQKYWQLGCPELVIFDPSAVLHPGDSRERVPLQVYRRDADGAYVRVQCSDAAVFCEGIQAFLVPRHVDDVVRLRIASDAAGLDVVPSLAEAREHVEQRVRELERRLAQLASDER